MQEGGNVEDVLTSGLEGGATGLVLGPGLGVASKGISKGVNILEKAGKNVIADTGKILDSLAVPLKVDTAKISPEIMNRVARVNPTDANNFKNLTGESIGEYLTKTGNFGAPDEIITNEASKFTKALIAKDTAMASLPGTYKNGAMEDLINGIKEKALATSGGNVKSPYLKTATTLENKLKKEGLTMKEISDAIRLYEKEIKLGYNKTLNPEKVQLATNIDRAAREFQDATAKQLGFENLPELNKQIQTSRAIVDSLGKKVVSNDLLNGVSLTDYITLSGGNPTSVGMFLTKKIFSNKGVQAKIAKMLSETASPSEIKAILGETKFPRLEVGKTKVPTQDLPINLTAKGRTQSQADINLQNTLKSKVNIPEDTIVSEAKKYKSAEEFVSKIRGSATQYGDYTPQFRHLGMEDYKNIAELGVKPDEMVTIYRGIDKTKGKIKKQINDGDFVTTDFDSAASYSGADNVVEMQVPAKTLYTDAVREFSEEPFYIGSEYVYTKQKVSPMTKSQLTDIWNKANKK